MLLAWLIVALLQTGVDAAPPGQVTAEAVVQRPADANNRGDVRAFADTYADDVELFEQGDKATIPHVRGRQAPIAEYAPMFAQFKPRATILSRVAGGEFVTDRECVTFVDRSMTATAVYRVRAAGSARSGSCPDRGAGTHLQAASPPLFFFAFSA